MPVDYSKWDSLELSDDSDIEVHPNVDKRSFIRAKQSQIHQQRAQRKNQIQTLKYEHIINDALASRISTLLEALKARSGQAASSGRSVGEIAFEALLSSYPGGDDRPPPPPEGVHSKSEQLPTYSKMMATLMDQVSKALDEKKPANRYEAMLDELAEHLKKVQDLQADLEKKLAELEAEEVGKITSESYHTGFDSSHVNKAKPDEYGDDAEGAHGDGNSASGATTTTKVELLNPDKKPSSLSSSSSSGQASDPATSTTTATTTTTAAAASTSTSTLASVSEEVTASPAARKFAEIPISDYLESARFLGRNPSILKEEETDGLLIMAFDAALEGRDEYSRSLVHQALLLQYCRTLGHNGIDLFFKRITTPGHQAREVFYKDVQETHARLRSRAAIFKEKENGGGDVEQIQLQAVEPGTVINIRVPPLLPEGAEEWEAQFEEQDIGEKDDGGGTPADTDAVAHADADANADADTHVNANRKPSSEEREALRKAVRRAREQRKIFESFSPELRTAVESGSLDEVNKVLGDMKLSEAEEVVSLLGEANVIVVEKDIIDTTTEEGQQQLQELKEKVAQEKLEEEQALGGKGKAGNEPGGETAVKEAVGDPE